MQSAYQLALQGSNATADSSTMQNLATQVTQLQQQLLGVANQQGSNGQYLFGGQKTNQQPFTVANGALTYNGDGNSINVEVGPNSTMSVNTPGSPLFSQAYQALQALQTDLQSGNPGNITNNDVPALQTSMASMSSAEGEAGAKSDEAASLTTDNTRRIQELTTQISGVMDINVTNAATNYAQAQSALQNALSVVSSGSSLTLSGFLNSSTA
jgi:flagellar hook-associated protein 3 FlgL